MDDLDRELLDLLRKNAREPTASLARKLGLARSTVQERIARLERNGVIKGYTVALDPHAFEQRIRAIVMISTEPKQAERAVVELKRLEGLRSLVAVSGSYDLVATVESDTPALMDALLDRIGNIRGIARTVTSIVLSEKMQR
ncbi:MAG TPA: Lrp/AsnC family transcriptional regulator [Alphaproteobacteria bacterium]|nr:Lrp/AsnC family transcriptional regulator [Alphaproteobacteria bacterium]